MFVEHLGVGFISVYPAPSILNNEEMMTKDKICPYCRYNLNKSFYTSYSDGNLMATDPKEGDVTICSSCAQVLYVDHNLDFRIPTKEEIDLNMKNPFIVDLISLVKKSKRN
jgi:hypothetical protein